MASFYPSSPLAGVFGGPLELVSGIVGRCPAYLGLNPTGAVYLYDRAPEDIEVGDTWVMLGYEDDDGNIMGGLVGTRRSLDRLSLSLVRAVTTATEEDKGAMVNLASQFVTELLEQDMTTAIQRVAMGGIIWATKSDPKVIGAVIRLEL
jgi:hypothetical protein